MKHRFMSEFLISLMVSFSVVPELLTIFRLLMKIIGIEIGLSQSIGFLVVGMFGLLLVLATRVFGLQVGFFMGGMLHLWIGYVTYGTVDTVGNDLLFVVSVIYLLAQLLFTLLAFIYGLLLYRTVLGKALIVSSVYMSFLLWRNLVGFLDAPFLESPIVLLIIFLFATGYFSYALYCYSKQTV